MKKIIMLAVVFAMLTGCSGLGKYNKSERCEWDNQTPTMELVNDDGEKTYICEDCASKCMYCGNQKVKRFGFNGFGMAIPICADCDD